MHITFSDLLYWKELYISSEQAWGIYLDLDLDLDLVRAIFRWCKSQLDLLDGFKQLNEPTSIINCEDWINVEKYEHRWAKRVNMWRQRYYKMIKVYVLEKVKGSEEADLIAINWCAKAEATPLSLQDVFLLEATINRRSRT